jgi:hypothetical protein
LKVANPFGLFDMHGNVSERCQDFHAADYYSKSPPNDPLGPSSGSSHVGRSGLWKPSADSCRSAFRFSIGPVYRSNTAGFRCVRVLDGSTSLAPGAMTPGNTGPVTLADLSRGLVGHWNFEEWQGAVVADSSGNKNDGKLAGLDAAKAWQSDAPPPRRWPARNRSSSTAPEA